MQQKKFDVADCLDRRVALKKTMDRYGLEQQDLSQITQRLEALGYGKSISRQQLCRLLKLKTSVHAETMATLELALPEDALIYYRSLINVAEAEAKLELEQYALSVA